ncbi:MAG: Hsp20 family protein [Candidatus Latescibacteria bacterium]|nr:Hsp20 family protein [bacterium]MBD3423465.1 Hsp20 family protein [Candidatus Latescibacterota bacterium]
MNFNREEFLRRMLHGFISGEGGEEKVKYPSDPSWSPSVDIIETTKHIIVIVDIAGMNSKDISIMTDGKNLKISGIRRGIFHPGEKKFHMLEIQVGSFTRELKLPARVESENRSATYENGLLKIKFIKASPDRVRKIEIE